MEDFSYIIISDLKTCCSCFTLHLVVQTLDDVVRYYRNTCSMLLPADNQMILRSVETYAAYFVFFILFCIQFYLKEVFIWMKFKKLALCE